MSWRTARQITTPVVSKNEPKWERASLGGIARAFKKRNFAPSVTVEFHQYWPGAGWNGNDASPCQDGVFWGQRLRRTCVRTNRIDRKRRPGNRNRLNRTFLVPPPQTSSGENSRRKVQNVVVDSTVEFFDPTGSHDSIIASAAHGVKSAGNSLNLPARHERMARTRAEKCRMSWRTAPS